MNRGLAGTAHSRVRARASHVLASMAVSVVVASFAVPAYASPESDAKDLFARARDLRAANDCGTAAPLFAKAWKIYPEGLGSLRNVAECEEQLGHFASARRAWLDLRRAIFARPPDPKYAGWEKDAEQAAARLKPKVASFVVDVYVVSSEGEALANESSGVELFVNGETVGTALVGTPLERDPGTYLIRAVTSGAEPVEQSVTIHAGENPRLKIRVTRTTPARTGTATQATTTTTMPPPPPPEDHAGRRTAGIVLASVGGAALVGSLVTFSVKNKAKSDLNDACPSHVSCPETLRGTVDRGKTMTTLTDILFPVGLVAAGAGAILIITSKSSSRPASAATEIRISPSLGGLGVTGRF